LTCLDATPGELVEIAAALGLEQVDLFTRVDEALAGLFPSVADAAGVAEVAAACAASGVGVCNLEYFPVGAELDLESLRGGLERGARLGASRATAHIHDPEPARGLSAFTALCDLAAEYGLRVGLEFTSFSEVRSLRAALAVVEAAGRENADVVLDALHFFRCGGEVSELAALDLSRVGYVQINDGPRLISEADRVDEAVHERLLPGTGQFPLLAFCALIPPGPAISIEVPQRARMAAGVSPLQRARLALEAARSVLAEARGA
jgi:sugar phosphate isomerase/epimerase